MIVRIIWGGAKVIKKMNGGGIFATFWWKETF